MLKYNIMDSMIMKWRGGGMVAQVTCDVLSDESFAQYKKNGLTLIARDFCLKKNLSC
jgi:hypothetical protein